MRLLTGLRCRLQQRLITLHKQERRWLDGFVCQPFKTRLKRVYGEGDATQSFAFLVGWGNNIVFEVDSASFTLQIFGDTFLAPDRTYHLCMIFEGKRLRQRAKGIPLTASSKPPLNQRTGNRTQLPCQRRTAGEFGDPAGTVAMGGTAVILIAPINGYYAQWAIWDGADAVLTDTEVREELFAKGRHCP
jgi:hypothetical protein